MASYLLLLNEPPATEDASMPSAEEIQETIARYKAWREKLGARILMGEKLVDAPGRVVGRQGDSVQVTDGPYAEVKEVLGGVFLLEASSYEEAAKLCEDCPHLDFGTIHLREIDAV
ncbi:MAG: YciI family protein [Acidobacteriota bacterium]